ncbi:MAG: alkaline phosphatase family protein [Devosia sp.]
MPKHVLLITADQWRADCVGAAGNAVIRTPHIDALASEGTLFERHYTAVTPCGPARTSIFTGMYAHNHRSVRNGSPLGAHFTNLALEARKAGYEPFLFGYTDAAADPRGRDPNDPAIHTYEGILPGFSVGQLLLNNPVDWLTDLKRKGYDLPSPWPRIFTPSDADTAALRGRPGAAQARYSKQDSDTAWLVGKVVDHLTGHMRSSPERGFFLHLAIPKPHPPLIAPAPYHTAYAPADMPKPVPISPQGQHPLVDWVRNTDKATSSYSYGEGLAKDLTEAEILQLKATYYGLCEEMDDQLGLLFSTLKSLGVWDDTLVVLTSDHGEQLGDHGLMGKFGFYEASQHVPLILRMPGGSHSSRVTRFTESVDLCPTLLDWLGSPIPNQVDGHSLMPFLQGGSVENWRNAAHWTYDFREVASRTAEQHFGLSSPQCTCSVLRGERYKYVHFAALPPVLFDLANDPDEQHNLADDPALRDIRLQCAEETLSWLSTHRDESLSLVQLGPAISYGDRR